MKYKTKLRHRIIATSMAVFMVFGTVYSLAELKTDGTALADSQTTVTTSQDNTNSELSSDSELLDSDLQISKSLDTDSTDTTTADTTTESSTIVPEVPDTAESNVDKDVSIPENDTDNEKPQNTLDEAINQDNDTSETADNTSSTIVSFPGEPVIAYLDKNTLENAINCFPQYIEAEMEDGTTVDVPVLKWTCTEDYENTDYDTYEFVPTLSDEYILSNNLTEDDIPHAGVQVLEHNSDIATYSSIATQATNTNWYPINSSAVLDSNYGFSFNTSYKNASENDGSYTKSNLVSWVHTDVFSDEWKAYYKSIGLTTNSQIINFTAGDVWTTTADKYHSKEYWSDGRIWFQWNNVGYYNGKAIDLKVSLVSIEKLNINSTGDKVYIAFSEDTPGVLLFCHGLMHPSFKYEFFEHSTSNPIRIKGHATFFDIDNNQGIRLDDNIVAGYYLNTGHLFTTDSTHPNFLMSSKDGTNNDMPKGWCTAFFDGEYFTATFCVNPGGDSSGPASNYDPTTPGKGLLALFGFCTDSVAKYGIPVMTKRTSTSEISSMPTGSTEGNIYNYYLEMSIPRETTDNRYSSIRIYDYISTYLKITDPKKITITDKTYNRDITSWFTNKSTTNLADFIANGTGQAQVQDGFYGITIEVSIPVQVRTDVPTSDWEKLSLSNNGRILGNISQLTINRSGEMNTASKRVDTSIYSHVLAEVYNGEISYSSDSGDYNKLVLIANTAHGVDKRKIPVGDNATYSFRPKDETYKLSSVTVNGKSVDISNYKDILNYTFSCVYGVDNKIVVKYEKKTGYIELSKSSTKPDITNGNDAFSLENAVYNVYTDESCNTTPIATLITDENGYAKSGLLQYGTYYIKEATAPKGFKLDEQIYKADLTQSMSNDNYYINWAKADSVYVEAKNVSDNASEVHAVLVGPSSQNWFDLTKTSDSSVWSCSIPYSYFENISELYGLHFYILDSQDQILSFFAVNDYKKITSTNIDVSLSVKDEPLGGWLELTKSSDAPDITDGNKCYTLQGAVYGVYSDEACTKELCRLTTDENGYVKSDVIPAGTVYVKEITAPTGYELDDTVYPVTITSGATVQQVVTDTPANDPVGITLTKISAVDNKNLPSLAGAQFTVKYYDGQYSSVNDLPAEATRTWVIETKERTVGDKTMYMTLLDTPYKVGGDDFYTIDENVTVPIGTMTIEETKTAFGYTMEGGYMTGSGQSVSSDNGIIILNITQDGIKNGGTIKTGNEYTKEEAVDYRSSITINKKGSDGNALAGAEFSLEIKGLDTGEWEYLESKTTDANGQLVFDNLIFGTYRIIETKAPAGNTLMAEPIIATLPYSSADGYTGDNWTFERDGAHYYCNVTFTVTNTATFDMLMSGGTSGMLPALMGFSFVLVAGGLLMTLKHKRKNKR